MTDGWIVVPGWDRFQHYRDRSPVWIKLYTELLDNEDWLSLTHAERGVLVQIWLLYARSTGRLRAQRVASTVHRNLRQRALDSLVEKGFIQIVASEPLALARARVETETEKEKNKNPSPQSGELERLDFEPPNGQPAGNPRPLGTNPRALGTNPRAKGTNPRALARFTGCRHVRGTHGAGYKFDPLGTDKPPDGWTHPRPTRAQIAAAMAAQDEEF